MTESMASTGSIRTGFSRKIRTLAIGALATATLSIPAVSAVSIAGHDAGRAPVIKPASHRLALGFAPLSLRLT
ncbi:MAG TPA: hypothetical protein VN816_09790 [Acidimicrobiales bacterium]|nr:hypothetical protein [Acidimicrobiales bacterium]